MKPIKALLLLGAAAVCLVAAFAASADAAPKEGRYIVVLNDSIAHPGVVAADQAEEVNGDVSLVYRFALKGYAATLPTAEVQALERDPRVDYVTPDRKVEIDAQTTPTGIERIFAAQNAGIDIDGSDDFRANADVAVIDTGIDYTHPDLNVVSRTNCVPAAEGETEKGCVDNSGTDGVGHGTHVAGTIGAIDNGIGVVGVAPGARLWAVRVLNNSGVGRESWIAGGIDWVTAHSSSIEVANMSLSCECAMPAVEEALDASVNAGVVYVVTAGNESVDAKNVSPAKNPNAITVSAIADYDGKAGGESEYNCGNSDLDDERASFSNFGSAVDIAAPGVCIFSTWAGGYAYDSGTSMAAPHVAGAAALLAARSNPNSKKDVEAIRKEILEAGNFDWDDTSGDGIQEPLLDVGDPTTFRLKIPPTVTTDPATEVTKTSATLNATVNPAGLETTIRFYYGRTTEYGSMVEFTSSAGGSVPVQAPVAKLTPGKTYHFTVVASSADGSSQGIDRTFTTEANTPGDFAAEWTHETEESEPAPLAESAQVQLEGTIGFDLPLVGSSYECDFRGSATLSPPYGGEVGNGLEVDPESCEGHALFEGCRVGEAPVALENPEIGAAEDEIVRSGLTWTLGFSMAEGCWMSETMLYGNLTAHLPSFPGELSNLSLSGTGELAGFGEVTLYGNLSVAPSEGAYGVGY